MRRRRLRSAFVITAACSVGAACASAPLEPQAGSDPADASIELQRLQAAPTPVASAGTASTADRDADRVADADDHCPSDPEDLDGHDDADGCPEADGPVVVIETSNPPIPMPVEFGAGSSQPTKESLTAVEQIALTLREHPEILTVVLEGNDDPASPRTTAIKLSNARATSVAKLLVKHGIDAKRLRTMATGAYCPLAQGTSEAERQRNRRIRFAITQTTDGPTGVELGCPASRAAGIVDTAFMPSKP